MTDFKLKVVVTVGSLILLLLLAVMAQADRGYYTIDEYQRSNRPSINTPCITATTYIAKSHYMRDQTNHPTQPFLPARGREFKKAWFGAGVTVMSAIVDLHHTRDHGIEYQCIALTGTPHVKLEALQSNNVNALDSEFVECSDGQCADIDSALTAETVKIKSLHLSPAQYLKIKLTGLADNPPSCYCNIRVFGD